MSQLIDVPSVEANRAALANLAGADPVLVDVAPAIEVVPGMHRNLVLASGPSMPWSEYCGGQRTAILGAVVYEGLAADLAAAADLLASGSVEVAGCQDYGCVGSLAGVTSASMPMVVVEDRATLVSVHSAHCSKAKRRLG